MGITIGACHCDISSQCFTIVINKLIIKIIEYFLPSVYLPWLLGITRRQGKYKTHQESVIVTCFY
jgi:hypothetical protein